MLLEEEIRWLSVFITYPLVGCPVAYWSPHTYVSYMAQVQGVPEKREAEKWGTRTGMWNCHHIHISCFLPLHALLLPLPMTHLC